MSYSVVTGNMGSRTSGYQKSRAQSSTVGFVLIIGIVITGALVVAGFGAIAVGDTNDELSTDRAENSLTQLDSKAALVALGESDSQTVNLPVVEAGGQFEHTEAGAITIRRVDYQNDSEREVLSSNLGAIVYQGDDVELAYQGGGVWEQSESGLTSMVSPPEFHYRGATVTLPVVNLTSGSSTLSQDAVLSHTATTKESNDTIIENEIVEIEVQSEYYRGWGIYFQQRTQSFVQYDHANNTVLATLVPNRDIYLTSAIISDTGNIVLGSNAMSIEGDLLLGGEIDTSGGGSLTQVDGEIDENQSDLFLDLSAEDEIEQAKNSTLTTLSDTDPGHEIEDGAYRVEEGSDAFGDLEDSTNVTFNTTDGDIKLYVEVNGSDFGPGSMDVDGTNGVDIYVNGSIHQSGGGGSNIQIGDAGQENQLRLYTLEASHLVGSLYGILVTGDATVGGTGGTTSITGALVAADNVTLNGNFDIDYTPKVQDFVLSQLIGPPITYLHVSENRIHIED